METNATIREGRILIESAVSVIKELRPNAKASVTFGFEMPLGIKNESEILSYLDKFLHAIRQFPESDRAHVVVNIPLLHDKQEELVTKIKSSYEKVMELALGATVQPK